jgi:hypothetical protein
MADRAAIVSRVAPRQGGSVSTTEALATRIRELIDTFNRLLAKPFRWTYTGRRLAT